MTLPHLLEAIEARLKAATPRELSDYLDAHGPDDLRKLLAIVKCMQAALEKIALEAHIVEDRLAWQGEKLVHTKGACIAHETLAEASKLASDG